MPPRHFSRHRPPWWPEGEPWPPSGPPGPRMWRQMRGRFFWRAGGLFALALGLVGLLALGRALRHLAMPIGDLMEAAGRVAEGDYSARVAEHGPARWRRGCRRTKQRAAACSRT